MVPRDSDEHKGGGAEVARDGVPFVAKRPIGATPKKSHFPEDGDLTVHGRALGVSPRPHIRKRLCFKGLC